jgi:hypothetical protein
VRDLLTFLEALGSSKVPLAEAIGIFKSPIEAGGLGRLEDTPDGHSLINHEGHTGGYNAYVGYVPEWNRGVVVLANAYPSAASDLGSICLTRGAAIGGSGGKCKSTRTSSIGWSALTA